MITIDGAQKSGSGTIVRYAVALAALSGQPLHLVNARAKRDQPGLRPPTPQFGTGLCSAVRGHHRRRKCGLPRIHLRAGSANLRRLFYLEHWYGRLCDHAGVECLAGGVFRRRTSHGPDHGRSVSGLRPFPTSSAACPGAAAQTDGSQYGTKGGPSPTSVRARLDEHSCARPRSLRWRPLAVPPVSHRSRSAD